MFFRHSYIEYGNKNKEKTLSTFKKAKSLEDIEINPRILEKAKNHIYWEIQDILDKTPEKNINQSPKINFPPYAKINRKKLPRVSTEPIIIHRPESPEEVLPPLPPRLYGDISPFLPRKNNEEKTPLKSSNTNVKSRRRIYEEIKTRETDHVYEEIRFGKGKYMNENFGCSISPRKKFMSDGISNRPILLPNDHVKNKVNYFKRFQKNDENKRKILNSKSFDALQSVNKEVIFEKSATPKISKYFRRLTFNKVKFYNIKQNFRSSNKRIKSDSDLMRKMN